MSAACTATAGCGAGCAHGGYHAGAMGSGGLLPLHRLRELEQGPDHKELAVLEAMEISQVAMEVQEAKGMHPGVEDHHKDRLVAIVVQTT